MPRTFPLLRFGAISLGLHGLLLAALYYFLGSAAPSSLPSVPVRVVRLPPEVTKRLPPLSRPVPRSVPREVERPSHGTVPVPKKFGTAEDVKIPRTVPSRPGGGEHDAGKGSKETAKAGEGPGKSTLPFLSQADIDEFARKGMPPKKPGEESVTLDTDEFKFISYNRWLKIKVESNLHYPELAAISGYQGVLYIKFDILKDGSLGDLELLKSSGYKILDDEALKAIRSSAPFAPLPDEWGRERYSIRAAVIFYLSSVYIR